MHLNKVVKHIVVLVLVLSFSCSKSKEVVSINYENLAKSRNVLDYSGTPNSKFDRKMLVFSDQGAWFGYGYPNSSESLGGFTGPFLMTQENGTWSSKNLSQLSIISNTETIQWESPKIISHNSHLEQQYDNGDLLLNQKLVFISGHTAAIKTVILNKSDHEIQLVTKWNNNSTLTESLEFSSSQNELIIKSIKSKAIGHIIFPIGQNVTLIDSNYITTTDSVSLKPSQSKEITIFQSFIFPEYSWEKEKNFILNISFDSILESRQSEKDYQLSKLVNNLKEHFTDSIYEQVLSKAHLTLQNNWRIPAGEIKHAGLFPSYHYTWFHGFWSWDSWKQAVGLSYYDTELAKNQMRAMFDFQSEDGFIVDCVYRDTSIQEHNYRDTKPPLSTWAVVKIYEKDFDLNFVEEFYPKLKKYHEWWYEKRDHDQDGLCEYGSTDGSLIAAKWESGMDNAIRFDNSKILKNEEGAFSLDQESVDLNAYLYAEKNYLATLAIVLGKTDEAEEFFQDAENLKAQIQLQFYDIEDGWFYDTPLDGLSFIKGEGSEGWTALWANVATQEQAISVKNKMMNPDKFYTKVPFQTMSVDHDKFDPLNGYWRGPNWLDQAYFGVKGLRNYGFNTEANNATVQILNGANGLLDKGTSIRENYHPITGQGLHAKNFSWSAAHIIMLLTKDTDELQ